MAPVVDRAGPDDPIPADFDMVRERAVDPEETTLADLAIPGDHDV